MGVTIIAEGAEINPFTVIGENNYIGQYTSIKNSVLWDHNILDKNVEIRGSILCNNIRVGNNTRIYEAVQSVKTPLLNKMLP